MRGGWVRDVGGLEKFLESVAKQASVFRCVWFVGRRGSGLFGDEDRKGEPKVVELCEAEAGCKGVDEGGEGVDASGSLVVGVCVMGSI